MGCDGVGSLEWGRWGNQCTRSNFIRQLSVNRTKVELGGFRVVVVVGCGWVVWARGGGWVVVGWIWVGVGLGCGGVTLGGGGVRLWWGGFGWGWG